MVEVGLRWVDSAPHENAARGRLSAIREQFREWNRANDLARVAHYRNLDGDLTERTRSSANMTWMNGAWKRHE